MYEKGTIFYALHHDPDTGEELTNERIIAMLTNWRDRARRHGIFDESKWLTQLIEALTASGSGTNYHHVDGG